MVKALDAVRRNHDQSSMIMQRWWLGLTSKSRGSEATTRGFENKNKVEKNRSRSNRKKGKLFGTSPIGEETKTGGDNIGAR
ncbi:hypothetical protein GOBAR_AA29682 [Gossypium barbadense]|uniref:Uncharacterized protein n=1 Tax=Gossypium barbadense TaxID=3634 RepID=A0A2P5WIV5_GOSBA|nr:hypothetical protein GOBAR_AA29682 [Gossypium barbadense]